MSETTTTIVSFDFSSILFGDMWYIGLLIFIILTVFAMKQWKYSAAFLLPIIFALEVGYYEHLDVYGNFVWPMIILLFLAIGVGIYAIFGKEKN